MHPVHNVDAILLLALSHGAKRRPAELVEIIAAIDLTLEARPSASKLSESFSRLSEHGLICAQDGGYALTPDALPLLSGPKKADAQERIRAIKENLAAYRVKGEHELVAVGEKPIAEAILAHQASRRSAGKKNMLMPKPKPVEVPGKRPGQSKPYQPFSARRRKD